MDSHRYIWRMQDGRIVEMGQPGMWPDGSQRHGFESLFLNGKLCDQPADPIRLKGGTYGTYGVPDLKFGDSFTLIRFYTNFPMVPNTATFTVEEVKPTGDRVGTVEVVLTLHHHNNDPFPNITGRR